MKTELVEPFNRPDFWNGLTVESHASEHGISTPYLIRQGTKDWLLCRNEVNPNMLFPIPSDISKSLKIRGYEWFKETVEGDTVKIKPVK